MARVTAGNLVGDDRADDRYNDADHDLGDPILHNCEILIVGGGIWTRATLEGPGA